MGQFIMNKVVRVVMEKLIKLLFLLVSISFITFFLVSKSPIDPMKAYIGTDTSISSEQRDEIARYWGLDKPIIERFKDWGLNVIHGDLGTSMIYRQPVLKVIKERFISSIFLMMTSWIMTGIIGFILGIIAGISKDKLSDKLIKWYCYIILSTPTFWIGIILISIFSVKLNIFPVALGVPIGVEEAFRSFGDIVSHMILPVITLSIVGVGDICLHTREKVIDVLNSEYVLYARANGESKKEIIFNHLIRNSILPAITLQFLSFSELFVGTIFVEEVFSYPGLGQALVKSAMKGDFALIMGIVIISVIFVYFGNLTADILTNYVDPRVRRGRENEK